MDPIGDEPHVARAVCMGGFWIVRWECELKFAVRLLCV